MHQSGHPTTAPPQCPACGVHDHHCSWCFRPIHSVTVIDSPDGKYDEWRHDDHADGDRWGSHRPDALTVWAS